MQQIQNKPLTALEKLISDKKRIRKQCALQEQKLNDDFSYIQENAGSLLLSGFTTLLFPNAKSKKTESAEVAISPAQPATPIGFSDYLGIAQGLLPVAWDIAKPFLLTWGIKKAQHWFMNLLFKKKK